MRKYIITKLIALQKVRSHLYLNIQDIKMQMVMKLVIYVTYQGFTRRVL
jgi:hypothetical protein